MKTAFSVWEQRIAPVFDTARQVQLLDFDGKRIIGETAHSLPGGSVSQKVAWLADHGIDALVCGAVSRPLQEQLAAASIRVIPFVAGSLREVIQAWFDGSLHGAAFTMPGCCGHRRGCRGEGRGRCRDKRKIL